MENEKSQLTVSSLSALKVSHLREREEGREGGREEESEPTLTDVHSLTAPPHTHTLTDGLNSLSAPPLMAPTLTDGPPTLTDGRQSFPHILEDCSGH